MKFLSTARAVRCLLSSWVLSLGLAAPAFAVTCEELVAKESEVYRPAELEAIRTMPATNLVDAFVQPGVKLDVEGLAKLSELLSRIETSAFRHADDVYAPFAQYLERIRRALAARKHTQTDALSRNRMQFERDYSWFWRHWPWGQVAGVRRDRITVFETEIATIDDLTKQIGEMEARLTGNRDLSSRSTLLFDARVAFGLAYLNSAFDSEDSAGVARTLMGIEGDLATEFAKIAELYGRVRAEEGNSQIIAFGTTLGLYARGRTGHEDIRRVLDIAHELDEYNSRAQVALALTLDGAGLDARTGSEWITEFRRLHRDTRLSAGSLAAVFGALLGKGAPLSDAAELAARAEKIERSTPVSMNGATMIAIALYLRGEAPGGLVEKGIEALYARIYASQQVGSGDQASMVTAVFVLRGAGPELIPRFEELRRETYAWAHVSGNLATGLATAILLKEALVADPGLANLLGSAAASSSASSGGGMDLFSLTNPMNVYNLATGGGSDSSLITPW
jgi:hypothetical protein